MTVFSSPRIMAVATDLEGVFVLEPKIFGDARGWFLESYNRATFADIGITAEFVQDNHSMSGQGVLRGLHYQIAQTQAKLVRVLAGEIFDVAVDLRQSSPTFGKWTSARISAENKRMMWVPAGCAHGFLVLSAEAEVFYKTTDFYAPEAERTIMWNDDDLSIRWPLVGNPVLSEKDSKGMSYRQAPLFP